MIIGKYDFLIVGAGLFGAVCARELTDAGKKCLVIEKRDHIAGNIYTKKIDDIDVHWYGGHIFHTSDRTIWNYVNRFAEFNNYINAPIANYCGVLYNLPFNMNTFYQMWGIMTPDEAEAKIAEQVRAAGIVNPNNLEEQAISLVGKDIYEKLIKGYTEKQWGRMCQDLPTFIIKRIPVRFRYDNNYFDDIWQGVPIDGYTNMIENMLSGIDVILGTDYCMIMDTDAAKIPYTIYTGQIDQYFKFKYGPLAWRGLQFKHRTLDTKNFQGVAVVNYTDRETPYTRVFEHKHFAFGVQSKSVVSWEYPTTWRLGLDAYYPVNDEENTDRYNQYARLAEGEKKVIFGGRLGHYKYYDMDDTITAAFQTVKRCFQYCS